MIFTPINYTLLLEDFLFSIAAGFLVGFVNQILSIVLYKGKFRLFVKDIILCFLFAVMVYSFTISFANYQVVRMYHIAGALLGFLCFTPAFSKIFQKFFKILYLYIKPHILWVNKKVVRTVCGFVKKHKKKRVKPTAPAVDRDLQTNEVWVYNL